MKTIYFKDRRGRKVFMEVSEDVEKVLKEGRQSEWRSEAKEEYHRDLKLQDLNDKNEELGCERLNPENVCIEKENTKILRSKMKKAYAALTLRQKQVLKLLESGKSCLEISVILGIKKQSVNDIRNSLKEKFKKFLK